MSWIAAEIIIEKDESIFYFDCNYWILNWSNLIYSIEIT